MTMIILLLWTVDPKMLEFLILIYNYHDGIDLISNLKSSDIKRYRKWGRYFFITAKKNIKKATFWDGNRKVKV